LTTVDDVKRALNLDGPVVAGISVSQGAMAPNVAKSGLIPFPTKKEPIIGAHAIVIVGYDDEKHMFKFVNSWGNKWGDKGFGYLSYDYFTKYGNDAWTFRFSTAE
jgi:C1A family cysteine protease